MDRDGAHVMKHVFRCDGLASDSGSCKSNILRQCRIEMVHCHDHVQMLGNGVDRIRIRAVGGRRDDVRFPDDLQQVRRVAAACAFRVVCMDGSAAECVDRIFDKTGFVQRVCMDLHLEIILVRHIEAAADDFRRGREVLVDLHADGTFECLFPDGFRQTGAASSQESRVYRKFFMGFGVMETLVDKDLKMLDIVG